MQQKVTAVFDIGRTNKKFFLFDNDLKEVYREYIQFDEIPDEDGYPSDNLQAIEKWAKEVFKRMMNNPKFLIESLNFSCYGATLVHIDEDGEVATDEKTRENAVQKATSEDEELDMYHGGMMGPVDPVSGNPIPVGSSAEEVRDDIDINISQGEYVLPADVVKWHGLKHIMDLQEEAKMGLMAMDSIGLIQEADGEAVEEDGEVCPECDGEGCDHCDGTGYHLEEETTPEDEAVEEAVVEVSEEEPEVNETDDYKDSDYSKKTSMYGMVKKPKVTFIV